MQAASQKYRIADIAAKFRVAKSDVYSAHRAYRNGKTPTHGALGTLCRAMEAAGISWAQVVIGPNVPGKKTGAKRHQGNPAPVPGVGMAAHAPAARHLPQNTVDLRTHAGGAA